ncbi:MAG: ABC transporter permease subunit, partial [Bacillota bacterium]|nr:ABC transporter permease subunit [Bacillota bacterium]
KPYYTSYKISQRNNFNNSYNNNLLTSIFYLIIFIQVITPIIFLLFDIESIKAIIPSIINNYNDILFTIITIFISSLFMVLFSTIFAYMSLLDKRFKSFIILLSIILLTIPSSFIGIAIISMYNNLPFDTLFYSPLLTAHTLLIRFIPISFLIIISDFNKYTKEYFDASIINTNSHLKIFKKIILPNSYKSLLYSFIVVSILAIGELGASIMILPPGKSTLSIIIYSYLHYGSSNAVKGLSLFVFISCIIFTLLILIIINKKGETTNYE